MNNKLVLRIKKRSQAEVLIWMILLLPFVQAALTQMLHFPNAVKYLCDVIWICMTMMLLLRRRYRAEDAPVFLGWVALFAIYTVLGYIINYQNIVYYFWGFRNNFRFYVVFLFLITFLKREDVDQYFNLFDQIFWINLAATIIQYRYYGIEGDYLGGIFGTGQGCNGYTVVFLSIVVTKSVIFCLENKEKIGVCLIKCAASLLIAALAEVKFFYVVFVVILAAGLIATKFSWRKILIISGGAIGLAMGVALLSNLFSDGQNWFSLDWFYRNAVSDMGYTSAGDLNRLNAITMINDRFLRNCGARLFGLGLGNCETSTFAFLNTPFFKAYGHLHYTWMSHAFLYLECGWIGLVFYYGFFVILYRKMQKMGQNCDASVRPYCTMTRILLVLCVLISVYNSTLRTEAGYMMYFALAAPISMNKH